MANKNVVLKSFNDGGESRCVDVFMRPDGTFGFEEFRRDVEDQRGWFAIGFFRDQVFNSAEDALLGAQSMVSWLNEVVTGSR